MNLRPVWPVGRVGLPAPSPLETPRPRSTHKLLTAPVGLPLDRRTDRVSVPISSMLQLWVMRREAASEINHPAVAGQRYKGSIQIAR